MTFSKSVEEKLKYYVYRLIDPRNGETFYVGKGRGNRLFAHAKDKLGADADSLSDKLQRIREIKLLGLEVIHVVHRHGISEETAFEVEAALMDAFPQVTNLVKGQDSDERGLMHANQIIAQYDAPELVFKHKVILIKINRSATEKSIYNAVRFAWKLNPHNAERCDYVLAVVQGLVVGVFIATRWLPATTTNFPGLCDVDEPGRWGFEGQEAPREVAALYLGCRVPDQMRKPGEATPFRYGQPS